MYLDDLPSAITLGESDTLYQENIPVGFFPLVLKITYDGHLKETAIFNHLDLKVIVSPVFMTAQELSSDYETDINVPQPISVFGQSFDVLLP